MNKYLIALMIFFVAVVLIFITILLTIEEPTYLTEDQIVSELNLNEKELNITCFVPSHST